MKVESLIILIVAVAAVVWMVSPDSFTDILNTQLVEGKTITVTGKLAYLNNPPLSQIVLPVQVWGIHETIFGVQTTRTFYLTRSNGNPILLLDGYTVGQTVKATGVIHIRTDVNLNKVYLIEYATLEIQP